MTIYTMTEPLSATPTAYVMPDQTDGGSSEGWLPKYPQVYPSELQYRPGRVQLLTADQEVVLKQVWAAFLKLWGYPVKMHADDISLAEAFVASSVTEGELSRQFSRRLARSTKSLKSKKLIFARFRRKHTKHVLASRLEALSSHRKASEPLSEAIETVYRHTFHQGYDDEAELLYDGDTANSGNSEAEKASLQSFHTAKSEFPPPPSVLEHKALLFSSKPQRLSVLQPLKTKKARPIPPIKHDLGVLHEAFFSATRNDLIDNFMLRFLRARLFDFSNSTAMLADSLVWRHTQYPINQWLAEADGPLYVEKRNPGFIRNFEVEKSVIRGHDRHNNPMFVFQARKHFAHDSPLPETERFALLLVEWCRLLLKEVNESQDTCTVMFDLSNFLLKNTDNAPIKFLAQAFEAHYPECLQYIIVHNALWIFSTVWNVIKNWIDPAVAQKIHFTKHLLDLAQLVDPSQIPDYLGGQAPFEISYPLPSLQHTMPPKRKDAEYKRLRHERDLLWVQLIEATIRWIEATSPEESSAYLRQKILLSYRLSDNYIALDPYVRNPGVLDRTGELRLEN